MNAFRLSLFVLLMISFSPVFGQYDSLKGGGIYASDFIISDTPRSLLYYMPANYGKRDSYPLVIFLHNDSGSAKNVIKAYGDLIHSKADAADCVVMYPDAIAGHWNSKTDTASYNKVPVNDVAFIGMMLDFFIQQYHCDADRIYMMGIGNGGNMCYRFNCERTNKLAALTAINALADGQTSQGCDAKNTAPLLDVNNEPDIKAGISKGWEFVAGHTKAIE